MFRELSEDEFVEVRNWFFNQGIDATEAGHRLALVEIVAKNKSCPMIDVHRELSSD